MKGYKKLMDIVAMVEKTVLVVTMILILVLTVGNVFSRKVIHQSWSFTEELVVAIFVLITLLGAALSAREGGLVGLNLVTERLPKSAKKPVMILITIFSVLFMGILFYYGMDKVLAQLAKGTIRGLVVTNQFDAGYFAVQKAVQAIEKEQERSQLSLESYYIEKDELRSKKYEKMLYPID